MNEPPADFCHLRHVVDFLMGVDAVPISQLPARCVCRRPFIYADVVYFVRIVGEPDTGGTSIFVEGYAGDRKLSGDEVLPFAEELTGHFNRSH